MNSTSPTSPEPKTYVVWADRRCAQQVEAASPEEAYREAWECPGDFEPCTTGRDGYEPVPEVMDLDSGEYFLVGPERQENPLANIDGDLLRKQSEWLLNYAEKNHGHIRWDDQRAIDGLINFLDEVRSYCHDELGVDCLLHDDDPEVIGPACPTCGNPKGCGA